MEKRIQELENVRALRELVDTFSILADKKDIKEQVKLFTEDANVTSLLNGKVTSNFNGREEIGNAFELFISSFENVYHLNGQHVVSIDGDKATGKLYCLVDLISVQDGKRMKNSSGVSYEDEYAYVDGKWLIAKRTSDFIWNESRELI